MNLNISEDAIPLLSIITLSRNSQETIDQTLDSLENQGILGIHEILFQDLNFKIKHNKK